MPQFKITVLKRTLNEELAKSYCVNEVTPCSIFKEGQEFISGFEKPDGFCDWAWNDLFKFVAAFLSNGSFAEGVFEGWLKDRDSMIGCCTDGIRPVIFKLERVE
ncbi:MAG TPA: TIGR04076 family protein [Chroococcales cyanobacterium]|jgi:uncharacterized repeat protein (TIGR04076 family)